MMEYTKLGEGRRENVAGRFLCQREFRSSLPNTRLQFSNREIQELESYLTHRKQRAAMLSNRELFGSRRIPVLGSARGL